MSYPEFFFNTIFYIVELAYFIAVIVYVAYTLGVYKPKFIKNDVPNNFDSTLNNTADFFEKAARLANKVSKAWNPQEEVEEEGEPEPQPPKAKQKAIQANVTVQKK